VRVAIICPVRGATEAEKKSLSELVSALEVNGHQVHYPPRDTDQSASGIEICRQNTKAIAAADKVFVWYRSDSQGVHFDLGAAFVLGKPIVIAANGPLTEGKSFPRMLTEWAG
jgi:nucleoside 2-deoxyribosyltransferase